MSNGLLVTQERSLKRAKPSVPSEGAHFFLLRDIPVRRFWGGFVLDAFRMAAAARGSRVVFCLRARLAAILILHFNEASAMRVAAEN